MPKDERLYMTFPNDFHRHPKVVRLPVEVRWTFVEMNGEARIADNDGYFTIEEAEFLWPREHLDALVGSHPARPLLLRTADQYVIREYSEHQQTRAEREELSAKRAEAGRKGGLAKRQASASKSLADSGKAKQSQSQSQSDSTKTSKSQSRNNRARDETDSQLSPTFQSIANNLGLFNVGEIRNHIVSWCQRDLALEDTIAVARWVLEKRTTPPDKPQRYVLGAIEQSPLEVQQHIDQRGLAA